MGRGKKKISPSAGTSSKDVLVKMPQKTRKKLDDLREKLQEICTTLSTDWDQFVEIYNILEAIQNLEKEYVLPKLQREENFEAFLDWCKSNDAVFSKVEVSYFEQGGFGFKVKETIQENEIWLTVPHSIMLTHTSAAKSSLALLMNNDPILSRMPNIALTLHLLNERCSQNSFWAPYINILPNSYDTPMYFTLEELQLLNGSSSLDNAIKLCRNIARQYAYFCKQLKSHSGAGKLPIKDFFTYDSYRWAVSTVMTRQNSIPSPDGTTQHLALVPLWDMCNHSNGKLSTDYNCEKNLLESYAFRKFEQDEQMYIFYGSRCNADLLLHNGFVYPENQFDSVAIKLELRKSDQLYAKKEEMLTKLGIPVSGLFYIYNGPSPIEGVILAFHRIAVMSLESLEKYDKDELLVQLKDMHLVLDDKTDQLCWKLLEMRLNHLIQGYPTTTEEDEELLAQKTHSTRSALAIQLRLLEKKILKSALDFITARDAV